MVTLPDARRYGVSASTGRTSVSLLRLGEIEMRSDISILIS